MKLLSALLVGVGLVAPGFGRGESSSIEPASQLEVQGKFKEAAQILKSARKIMAQSEADRRQLEFELDRLERIKRDYPYTKESLFKKLKQAVKGLTVDEFEQWIADDRFDVREIDGERRFMGSSVSNLFFRYPELNPRRVPPQDTTQHDRSVWETCLAIRQAALAEKKPYVLPKRFHTTMTVTAKANAAPHGEVIRAWLPIPRRYPFQTDFRLLLTSATPQHLDDEQNPIRALYLEQTARRNNPTVFEVEYEYTMHGVWFDLKPDAVKPVNANDPALKPYLGEAPHVVFTPEMRALSGQIAGGETNPARKAKKFHDWIAENIKYSFALEYSTIRNLGDYCRVKGYGDCGQEALLFITLCRLNGIPARWQSGWSTFPGAKTIHDWCEIYLEPYGWIPVDNYQGIWAMQYAFTLTTEQRREVRDFYFGGLDYYRMAANSDHNQPLNPPKKSFRSDNVDFQRGELESGGRNIYFDRYSYKLEVKEVNPRVE